MYPDRGGSQSDLSFLSIVGYSLVTYRRDRCVIVSCWAESLPDSDFWCLLPLESESFFVMAME